MNSLYPETFSLKEFLKNTPEQAGVYQMLDSKKKILYVGKAKNLKNRLSSYLHPQHPKVIRLMSLVQEIQLTICLNEEMALRVELSLIQNLKPPYNVLLKDDKSFAFIVLSQHDYPCLFIHRSKSHPLTKFRHGPYPSLNLAKEVFQWILKQYQLRTCSDFVFKSRTRPCLEHQIGHCQAPCVYQDPLSKLKYDQSVAECMHFLQSPMQGKLTQLQESMKTASLKQDFEKAAYHRDLIRKIHAMQRRAYSDSQTSHSRFDVLGIWMKKAQYFVIVHNEIESSETFSISNPLDLEFPELLEHLILQRIQHLETEWIPKRIICDIPCAFGIRFQEQEIEFSPAKTEHELKFLKMAQESVLANRKTLESKNAMEYDEQFSCLEKLFSESQWESIECADVSHFQGQHTVGAVVRFHRYGPEKKLYRLYKIAQDKTEQNNDPLSMQEMILRHMKRRLNAGTVSNLLLIDGGPNQLRSVYEAFVNLKLSHAPHLLAITKDPSRKRGLEKYFSCDAEGKIHSFEISSTSYEALLLQEIRDEAHRCAGQFRHRLVKKSLLAHPFDQFRGLNPIKKREILNYFGGWKGLIQATEEQIYNIKDLGEKMKAKLWTFISQSSASSH